MRVWALLAAVGVLAVVAVAVYAVRAWWIREWAPRGRVELVIDALAAFRARLWPSTPLTARQLQRRVARRSLAASVVTLGGQGQVPDTVVARVNPFDLAAVPTHIVDRIAGEVAVRLTRQGRRAGWRLGGRPVVVFVADAAVPERHPRITVGFDGGTQVGKRADSDSTATPTAVLTAASLIHPEGRYPPLPLGVGGGRIVIGRSSTCDLRIEDPRVSRRHAVAWPDADGWLVAAEAGVTNGLFVNGVRAQGPVRLADGDVLGFGRAVQFRFRVGAAV